MERYGLSSEDAFATLRRVSQQSNTKLHHIATELISTRQTPGQDQDHPWAEDAVTTSRQRETVAPPADGDEVSTR